MHNRKCCIIYIVHVLTMNKLLRLFLGMNCPVYALHEHSNTEQAKETRRHSHRFLQVRQRRHFVCDLTQSVKKSEAEHHKTHINVRSMIRCQVFVSESQFRPSSGIKIGDVIGDLFLDGRIGKGEFDISDGWLVSRMATEVTSHIRCAFGQNYTNLRIVDDRAWEDGQYGYFRDELSALGIPPHRVRQWGVPTKSEAVVPTTHDRISGAQLQNTVLFHWPAFGY